MRRGRAGAMLLLAGLGCVVRSKSASDSAGGKVASDSEAPPSAATPVTMGVVRLRTIEVTVSGTGEVDALNDERVRAPFTGVVTSLTVSIGDRVAAGQVIGAMIAENSDAALRGARSMVAAARTPAQRAAANEALRLAEASIVRTPLVATKAGVVLARPSSTGERLVQGDSVVSIATTGHMVFFADIAQSDLRFVRGGQSARVDLAARHGVVPGVVHNIMPADTGSTATMRVRIDLVPNAPNLPVGMFGKGTIVVDRRVNVPAVPRAALLRDDVTGKTRVAVVSPAGIARWVDVVPGVGDSVWVEITSPRLTPGQRVIAMGQVGLPDSTRVVAVTVDTTRR